MGIPEAVMKAANRYEVITRIERGLMKMCEASLILDLSIRQVRRLRRKSERDGLKGLIYQRSHKACNRVGEKERREILRLRRDVYRTYNLLHFRDVLSQKHELIYSREFYRQLFLKEKLYKSRFKKKRRREHRLRFEAPQAGMLIQRDTSIHLWAPDADKPWKLILDLDDHSRKITGAYFSAHDDVLSNMFVAWETISTHGIPLAYYTDNNPIFNPLNKKPKTGMYYFYRARQGEEQETVSQFKRAVTELGIKCIHATPYQPQGKGKVERIFRFMQDRLVNEMNTANIQTLFQANKYLKKWVSWYNHHHVHSVTKMIPNERYLKNQSFRPLSKHIDLEQIFCLKYSRQVKADNTFQLDGKTYQIKANEYRLSYARAMVQVRIYLSGIIKVYYKEKEIDSFKQPHKSPKGDILAWS